MPLLFSVTVLALAIWWRWRKTSRPASAPAGKRPAPQRPTGKRPPGRPTAAKKTPTPAGGPQPGEIWWAEVGRRRRPVLVLTRSQVIEARQLVTVAEVTTTIRNLSAEVSVQDDDAGLDRPSVVNCDGIHTISQASVSARVGSVGDATMRRVCSAIGYALGC